MKKIDNFIFLTNVSIDTYKNKQEAMACLSKEGAKAIGKNKMAFSEQSVTVTDFLGLATSGHAFCNLFNFDPNNKYWIETSSGGHYQSYPVYKKSSNKGAMKLPFKSDKYFRGSQTVFVDIDFTRYTDIPEYISTLTLTPTCVYMSFSDNKEKKGVVSRRFRLVYVLDQIVGKDEFYRISRTISDRIVIDTAEPMDDDCGTRACQYMNGVFGNNETYQSNCIYSVSDFTSENYAQYYDCPTTRQQDESAPMITFDENLLKDMGRMGYSDFMHYYSKRYKYLYRTERPAITEWIDGLYQLTDENYLQLWYYREKQVDGQNRRRKLFKNACLRRLMYPDIDSNTLLFNLYVDFVRFFDNSDKVITLDTLKRKVVNAMKMTHEQLTAYCNREIQYWHENRPKFICKAGIITTRGQLSSISKRLRWAEIDKLYDETKSIGENLATIDVPISTLYRYCNDRWIDTNPNQGMTEKEKREAKRRDKDGQIKLFRKLYDPNLSLRENVVNMENNGLKLGKTTLSRWIEQYYEPTPAQSFTSDFTLPDFMGIMNSRFEESEMETPVSDWDKPEASSFINQVFGTGIPVPELNWTGWGWEN